MVWKLSGWSDEHGECSVEGAARLFTTPYNQFRLILLSIQKRVTRLVVVVVLVFAGCWCPIQIVLLLKTYNAYTISMDSIGSFRLVIQITAHVLAYTNSCLNPILYAFLSENFRKAFHKVIVCWSSSSSQMPATMTDFRGAQSEVDRAAIEMSVNNKFGTKAFTRTRESV